jgi:hypothetical protein
MRRNFKIQKAFFCLIMRKNGEGEEGEADNKKITGLQPKLNLRLGMSS